MVAMGRPRSDPLNLDRLPQILNEIRELQAQVSDRLAVLEHQVVQLCRDNHASWESIGDELGVSRQTAEKRFKIPRRRRPGGQSRAV